MPWPEHLVKSWDDFVKLAARFAEASTPFHVPYLFRGSPNASYTLQPTFVRLLPPGITTEQAVLLEKRAVFAFKREGVTRSDVRWPADDASMIDWWAVMQHYRAPTRLLDWTASIYVAAYFAVEQRWDVPGAIYLFHTSTLHYIESASEEKLDAILTRADAPMQLQAYPVREYLSPRMVAQQGHFTFCLNVLGDHAALIESVCSQVTGPNVAWGKIVIPETIKPRILDQLRHLNVTAASLFPGLDGLGMSLVERVRLAADNFVRNTAASERLSGQEAALVDK